MWVFRAGYISARLLTKPGPAMCSLTAVTSGRSESPEGQPAEQVSGPASAQAVMLRDRFVNILNMNITQIIGVGNVTLGDLRIKICCWQEEVLSSLIPCNEATFCPIKPQESSSNLTSFSSWIFYTFATKSKSKSARPSKGGRRELSPSPLHSWDTGCQ